jgi:NitT/TauT family transport system substrate-binding protein
MSRLLSSLVVFGLGAAALIMASSAHAVDAPRPLRIGYVLAMGNAPALIADKKGYYAAEGLKVDVRSFGDGPVVQQAVAGGDIDIAYVGTPPAYQWYARGLDVRILAKVNSGQAALIGSDSVKTLADLKGKKIAGVAKGSGMDVLLRGPVLERLKLVADQDVTIVAMPAPNMGLALERHVVDAIFTWEPFVTQTLLRGTGKLLLDVDEVAPHYPWYVITAPSSLLASRPDDVVKLLRAHHKAIAFLQQHPAEADLLIAKEFAVTAIEDLHGKTWSPADIVHQARNRLSWDDRLQPNDLAFIQSMMNASQAQGLLPKPLKVADVVDTRWFDKATASP